MEEKEKALRIVIACGGTGGHLFPGIAVAQKLRAMGHRPLLLISRKQVDAEGAKKYEDLEFRTVPAIAKPRTFSLRMIGFMWKLMWTLVESRSLLKKERADVVLGMGGFTSLAPVLAGHLMGLRTYIHDSNSIPGRANRLTAKFCTETLLGLEEAESWLPGRVCRVVGTPVRGEVESAPGQAAARATLGLPVHGTLLLVTGGSQGAQKLNTMMVEAAQAAPEVQFLIVAGKADQDRVAGLATGMRNVTVMGFCADMAAAYAAADGVITRSGASTLTELSILGKACMLVPYPFAADNHQYYNAKIFSEAGAAVLCKQEELSVQRILDFIEGTLQRPDARDAMQRAMLKQAHPEAAQTIAQILAGEEA